MGLKIYPARPGKPVLICSKLQNAAVIAKNPFENSNKSSLSDKN